MATLPADKRILHIAAEVAETNDANVPVLLLGLKGESPIIDNFNSSFKFIAL